MEKYLVKTIIEPILNYLKTEKNIVLTQKELDSIFQESKTEKLITSNSDIKTTTPNVPTDDRCIYTFQKKKQGERCTKKAKYYGYCTTHKNTKKAEKDIKKRMNNDNTREEMNSPKKEEKKKEIKKGNKKEELPKVIEPSNPEDINSDNEEEIYQFYKDEEFDLLVRPSLKHIVTLKEENNDYKLIWLYKYEKGKWSIPTEDEIKNIDTIDSKYVKYENYSKLEPEKKRLKIKSLELDLEPSQFYTEAVREELGV